MIGKWRELDIVGRTGKGAICIGALMIVSALPQLVMRLIGAVPGDLNSSSPPPLDVLNLMWRHGLALTSFQTAMGILVVVAGMGVLRFRSWARCALEVSVWVALIAYIGIGVLWVRRWVHFRLTTSTAWSIPFAIGGLVALVFWSYVFVLVIRFLKGTRLRTAIRNGQQAA